MARSVSGLVERCALFASRYVVVVLCVWLVVPRSWCFDDVWDFWIDCILHYSTGVLLLLFAIGAVSLFVCCFP